MQRVAVLGLGIIGGVWASHYHAAGCLAGAWNRTPMPGFPQWNATAIDAAEQAEAVQIVVADPPAVRAVLEAIASALGPGKTVIQSSTIDPESSDSFRELVAGRGARYLEAPFTGSKPAAEQRQSVFYLGGEPDLVAEFDPLLSLVSAARFAIGTNRQACTLKLAMNLNIAAQMQALCEALTLARHAGIPDDTFFATLGRNVSHSGLAALKENKLREADYSPQFSVKHMAKDMRLAALAECADDLPLLGAVRDALARAEASGLGDEDFSALMKGLPA